MTPEFLLDALVEEIKELFRHHRRANSLGTEREINVFPQDPPIREGDDEGENTEAPPEPYVTVRLVDGGIDSEDDPHMINVVLLVSTYDRNPNRQGFRDAMHIIGTMYRHFIKKRLVAGKYLIRYPFKWAIPDDDHHPYYYAGMSMRIETQAVKMEEPET